LRPTKATLRMIGGALPTVICGTHLIGHSASRRALHAERGTRELLADALAMSRRDGSQPPRRSGRPRRSPRHFTPNEVTR
jgi:hypothetical protein